MESPKLSPTDGYWVFLKPLLPGGHPIYFARSCRVVVRGKQIYSAAISVSQDVKLRQSIRESVEKESELLGSIGFAHMEQEIQRMVIVMSKEYKDRLTKKTGLESSLNENEMKEYLNVVLNEIRSKKKYTREVSPWLHL